MKLTKTEKIAYKELKDRGYKKIIKTNHNLPDFICDEKDRYEIKKIVNNILIFTPNQIINFKDTDRILVYKDNKLINEFLWKNKGKIRIYMKELLNVVLDEKTKEAIKKLKEADFNISAIVRSALIEKAKKMK